MNISALEENGKRHKLASISANIRFKRKTSPDPKSTYCTRWGGMAKKHFTLLSL